MSNFTDIAVHVRKLSNVSNSARKSLLINERKQSAHTRNEAFSNFQAQTDYTHSALPHQFSSHLKSFSQIQPDTDPHRKSTSTQSNLEMVGKKKKIRHISDVNQLNLQHKNYHDATLKEDIDESIISQASSQPNDQVTQRTVVPLKQGRQIAPYFNTEITIKKVQSNSRN